MTNGGNGRGFKSAAQDFNLILLTFRDVIVLAIC